jgi:hypothetical protein
MAKKSSSKPAATKSKGGMSPADHRKMADEHHAKARLHSAQADLMDAKNPPKKGTTRGYPY